jgi:hypothetical protein
LYRCACSQKFAKEKWLFHAEAEVLNFASSLSLFFLEERPAINFEHLADDALTLCEEFEEGSFFVSSWAQQTKQTSSHCTRTFPDISRLPQSP